MIKVTLDILAQIILSSLRFAQERFELSLSQSHTIVRSLGDAGSRNVFEYVCKLKQRRNTDLKLLFRYQNPTLFGLVRTQRGRCFCSAIKLLLRSLWFAPNEADATGR